MRDGICARRARAAASCIITCCALLAACGGSGDGGGTAPSAAATPTTTVGGTVTGVTANGRIVLTNNGGDAVTVAADGPFTFPTRLTPAQSFAVVVSSTSAGETCAATRASGSVSNALAAANVQIACGPVEQKAFHPAAAMRTARSNLQLVKLDDGTIVAFGGFGAANQVERYDTKNDTWTTLPALPDGVSVGSAAALHGSKVLLFVAIPTGGFTSRVESQVYDTATGALSPTGAFAQIAFTRQLVRLLDGRVLATDDQHFDLYDPVTNLWTATGTNAASNPVGGTLILMADGNVLLAGGRPASIYDVQTGSWSPTGNPVHTRLFPTAFLLANGRVLVVGGIENFVTSSAFSKNAELFDPVTGQWTPAGTLAVERINFAGAVMPTGKVVLAGGSDTGFTLVTPAAFPTTHASSEAYDPSTNTWSAWADLSVPRDSAGAIVTNDGKLLVSGGLVRTQTSSGQVVQLQPTSEIGW
jgi:hypothetical protein